MNDETPDIDTATRPGEATPRPEDVGDGKAVKKKRRKASAKAATAALEARIGHKFTDATLLATAFTHVSALKAARKRSESYQRLEFLGDHVLGLVVSDMLYRAFPNADEGELSKRLSELVRKESCADVAKQLGLTDDIKLGAVGAGAGARLRISVLGDICEAVIGAVYLDGGHAAAEAAAAAARSQDGAAGMGPGQGPADAGVPRGRAHRAASRSAIPGGGGFAGA